MKVIIIREESGDSCSGCVASSWVDCDAFKYQMDVLGIGDCIGIVDDKYVNYIYKFVKEER